VLGGAVRCVPVDSDVVPYCSIKDDDHAEIQSKNISTVA
jgi:hypothetical protein